MTKKYPPPLRALYCKYQLKEAGGWGRETWMDIYSYVLARVCENEAIASSSVCTKNFIAHSACA
jgi:hypothetical protein